MTRLEVALFIQRNANLGLEKLARLLFPRTKATIEKLRIHRGNILVLRTGNIGDIACTMLALAALRENFPGSRICLITSPGGARLPGAPEVLSGLSLVDEIVTFHLEDLKDRSYVRSLVANLRRRRFDLFVHLPQERASLSRLLRDLAFAGLLGAQGVVGFKLAYHFPLFDLRTLKDFEPSQPEAGRLLEILRRAGIHPSRSYELALPPAAIRQADDLLKAYVDNGRPIIGIQARAKEGAKNWPMAKFAELCRKLQRSFAPLFVFTGGPADRQLLENLSATFPGDKVVAAGLANIQDTMALISRCQVFISVDTGPMHLAALIGVPLVALFSARQFKTMWDPFSPDAVVLRKSVPCELCFQAECEHGSCMEAISVDEVFDAVTSHLPQGQKDFSGKVSRGT